MCDIVWRPVLEKLARSVSLMQLKLIKLKMSFNSNSTQLLWSELNQTHELNELTHQRIFFKSVYNIPHNFHIVPFVWPMTTGNMTKTRA